MLTLRIFLLSLIIPVVLLSSCQQHHASTARIEAPRITSETAPLFIDDGDRRSLISCARNHRVYLEHLPLDYTANIAGKTYPKSWLLSSMDAFISLLESNISQTELSRKLQDDFIIVQAEGRQGKPHGEMLVTGYYEPLFAGSLTRKAPYLYPLYSVPKELITRSNTGGNKSVGRIHSNGSFIPFYTRGEIEKSGYLAGRELVYLRDPFDAFLLHVQGSGRILLPDGTEKSVRFAGHNGHQYKSIGKLLVDEGKLTLEETSIPTIRQYLEKHPEEQQRILHHNPRFIFFAWGDNQSPPGSLGIPLTPGRSIAIDRKTHPDSVFGWLKTSVPEVDSTGAITGWKISHRFVLPQDSGAAIKGPGRVDLFWGNGTYAEIAASNMKQQGQLYFFIKKGYSVK